jgi:hypothetical protein
VPVMLENELIPGGAKNTFKTNGKNEPFNGTE